MKKPILWGAVAAGVIVAGLGTWGLISANTADAPTQTDTPAETSLEALPLADTHANIAGAPADPAPDAATRGVVVHPTSEIGVHDLPGGKAFAKVTPETQVGDTWLPVIDERDGWVQVLLPSKPNSSAGWVAADDVDQAASPSTVTVSLSGMTLTLEKDGSPVGTWPIGIGSADAPTPVGRTFVHGQIIDDEQDFSPVILPLGTHSPTLNEFGGGPGTVAIHGWPTDDVLGAASSDGCIRVPAEALDILADVPLGTVVHVEQ